MIILSGCGLGVVKKVTPLLKCLRTPLGMFFMLVKPKNIYCVDIIAGAIGNPTVQ